MGRALLRNAVFSENKIADRVLYSLLNIEEIFGKKKEKK